VKHPLVLLHGWGVNSLIWNRILPLLESDFDLTVINLPGYSSEIEYGGDYSLDAIANEVLARAPDQAIWVGWSLGGTIAMAAALAQPQRFLKLQLVSTTPRFLKGPDWQSGVSMEPFESLADDFDRDYEKAIRKFLLLQVFTGERSKLKDAKILVRDLSQTLLEGQRPTGDTLQAGLRLLGETDLRPRLAELKVQTQVIAGRNDHLVPVKASEFLFSRLENGHSIHVLETGHLPFLEAPSKYIEALTNFANSD
jgi:pimeloyl-[acyl-carrier protein] methyl ester esterase